MAWSHADRFFRIELVGGQKTIEADWSDDYPYQVGPSYLLLSNIPIENYRNSLSFHPRLSYSRLEAPIIGCQSCISLHLNLQPPHFPRILNSWILTGEAPRVNG